MNKSQPVDQATRVGSGQSSGNKATSAQSPKRSTKTKIPTRKKSPGKIQTAPRPSTLSGTPAVTELPPPATQPLRPEATGPAFGAVQAPQPIVTGPGHPAIRLPTSAMTGPGYPAVSQSEQAVDMGQTIPVSPPPVSQADASTNAAEVATSSGQEGGIGGLIGMSLDEMSGR